MKAIQCFYSINKMGKASSLSTECTYFTRKFIGVIDKHLLLTEILYSSHNVLPKSSFSSLTEISHNMCA
jgi:hypothetical protein